MISKHNQERRAELKSQFMGFLETICIKINYFPTADESAAWAKWVDDVFTHSLKEAMEEGGKNFKKQ